ncbi:MAG: COX15/CtaA family protein [Planctomycetes bacterium]|nr:COX15/CtaA family protein [Planctomycetota bacterium]
MTSRGLFRFAVFVTAYVLIHIKLGALVTSTGSGMAFEDWPLSEGSVWPPGMDKPKYLEHIHRVSGTLLGLFSLLLVWFVYRNDRRVWLRRTSILFVVVVTVQGIFGGLGVVYGDMANGITWAPAAIVHGTLAQPTLCLAAFIAFALSSAWHERVVVPAHLARTARKLAGVAFGLVFAQILMGAIVRHTNATGMLWLHVFSAVVVALAILVSTSYNSGKFGSASPGLRRLGFWIWILLMTQLVLGFATLLVRKPKDPSNIGEIAHNTIASAHVVVGASVFVIVTLLFARVWRTLEVAPASARATATTVA